MGSHLKDLIDPVRFEALKKHAGFTSDLALANALGVKSDQPGRWKRGDTSPSGAALARLCDVLKTSAPYLFGRSDDAERVALLQQLRVMYGRTAGDVVEWLGRLTPHHRAILAGEIKGWVRALELLEQPRTPAPEAIADEEPLFPADADRGLALRPSNEATEPADTGVEEQPPGRP